MNRSKTEQARSSRLRRVAPILLLACIAAGCEAVMAALPIAMGFARNAMQVNDENYGADSVAQLEKLFESYFPAGTAVSATTTAAVATEQTEAPEEPTEVVTEVPDRPPLALDTALLRDDTPRSRGIRGGNADTKFELTALDADAVLRDGVHRDERGDRLRISFAAHEACWVYVVEIDATGYVVPVFPNPAVSTGSNPVTPGRTYLVPDGDEAFELDGYRGTEHFLFLASRERQPHLESLFEELRARPERPDPDPESYASVTEGELLTRGIKGGTAARRTHRVATTSSGQTTSIETSEWFGETGADEIVVALPFEHR